MAANEAGNGVDAVSGSLILPFYLAGESGDTALIRGRLASVGLPATTILQRHQYPAAVASLQAEALAIAACLSTFMKFDGVFTLQAKGDAFVKTLFADVTSAGALRGYAAFDETASVPVADDVVTTMPANVPTLLGSGYAAFTVDQGTENGRYQGIVELDGDTLSDAAMAWFANSEQVDSHIVASAAERDGTWTATALMLQRVASDGGAAGTAQQKEIHDDVWHTAKTLLQSVRCDELVDPDLGAEALVFRLFNSLRPHVAPAQPVADQCRCSPQKVESVLAQMAPQDLGDLVAASGKIEVTCEFCKIQRDFDPESLMGESGTSTRH